MLKTLPQREASLISIEIVEGSTPALVSRSKMLVSWGSRETPLVRCVSLYSTVIFRLFSTWVILEILACLASLTTCEIVVGDVLPPLRAKANQTSESATSRPSQMTPGR